MVVVCACRDVVEGVGARADGGPLSDAMQRQRSRMGWRTGMSRTYKIKKNFLCKVAVCLIHQGGESQKKVDRKM